MKALLTTLNSKYAHSNLALKYLYNSCKDVVSDLSVREYTINNDDEYIFNELVQGEYDVIAFSCYVWNIEKIKELCENIKLACPKTVIVLGGPEVSFETATFLRENPSVSFIVRGEGEYSLACLLEHLEKNFNFIWDATKLSKITGISFRNGDSIGHTPDTPLLKFDSIPFPYENFQMEKDKVIYYESSRGCPFNCSYCMSAAEKKIRAISLERTLEDVQKFIYAGVKQVKFIDRTFNWDAERAYEIFKYIMDHDLGRTNFHFELCGDLIDLETLYLLSDARKGLFDFEIGIQSVKEETLKACNRTGNLEACLNNCTRLITPHNVHVHVDLIAGLPYESYDDFKESFNKVYALKADAFQMGFLKLLKGTEMRDKALYHGYVFRKKAPYEVISNKYITASDMTRLKQIEYLLDHYYNRGGFSQTLDYLTTVVKPTPFDFFEEFAAFYNLKKYQEAPKKKEDLYRILKAYIEWKAKDDINLIKEVDFLLMEDMSANMNPEAIKRFLRAGWGINGR